MTIQHQEKTVEHIDVLIVELSKKILSDTNIAPIWCDEEISNKVITLLPEFTGKSELCLFLIHLIVKLRREIEVEQSATLFLHITRAYYPLLIEQLNSRWLISILDTLGDYGTEKEKAQAMAVVALFNMVKIAESELRYLCKETGISIGLQTYARRRATEELWDGMTPMTIKNGDIFGNMIRRIYDMLENNACIKDIFTALFCRACKENTILGRICNVNEPLVNMLKTIKGDATYFNFMTTRSINIPQNIMQQLSERNAIISSMLSSRSWRITAPLRMIASKFRRAIFYIKNI